MSIGLWVLASLEHAHLASLNRLNTPPNKTPLTMILSVFTFTLGPSPPVLWATKIPPQASFYILTFLISSSVNRNGRALKIGMKMARNVAKRLNGGGLRSGRVECVEAKRERQGFPTEGVECH